MPPGDRNGSPDESFSKEKTIVLIDEGFIYKLSKHLTKSKNPRFDRIKLSDSLAKKQGLLCEKIFYYNAPPFQSQPPTKEEELRKEGYDKFIKKLQKNSKTIVREGRCQRLKIDGKYVFKQKGVDSLIVMDLMSAPIKFPKIKKIILIASDSDFVPSINELRQFGVKIILYTYYEKKRSAEFSRSNDLIKSVYKYILLTKQDFENATLKQNDKHNPQ